MAEPIRLNSHPGTAAAPANRPAQGSKEIPAGQLNFAETLSRAQEVKFSNHAQKRLETRNISLSEDGLARLASAVDRAGQRGGRDSLVLMDDMAFIVNVRDRLVVTAMDANSRREGVFTQIDSVVFAEPANLARI
jgi:flagellar operon protein